MSQNGVSLLKPPPPAIKGPVALPRDLRMLHVKTVAVGVSVLVSLLQGAHLLDVEGWPEGAAVLAAQIVVFQNAQGQKAPMVVLLLHHPEFPIVEPGTNPPTIELVIRVAPIVAPPDSEAVVD